MFHAIESSSFSQVFHHGEATQENGAGAGEPGQGGPIDGEQSLFRELLRRHLKDVANGAVRLGLFLVRLRLNRIRARLQNIRHFDFSQA